ncbi:MAG: MaoC family dehydratase [Candidatus Eremiobacteraeota bacterium]|nr:MaoC family dehydratase [Candidatus Eremiobacteraeota bacterium]
MKAPPVGASAQISRTVDRAMIKEFAEFSGDDNPMHLSPEFAKRTRFGRPVAHGMLTASLISAVIGTKLPGPGCIYVSQTLNFRKPVFEGDTITTTATVLAVNAHKPLVTLRTECANQRGERVLDGEALVLLDDLADPH